MKKKIYIVIGFILAAIFWAIVLCDQSVAYNAKGGSMTMWTASFIENFRYIFYIYLEWT